MFKVLDIHNIQRTSHYLLPALYELLKPALTHVLTQVGIESEKIELRFISYNCGSRVG